MWPRSGVEEDELAEVKSYLAQEQALGDSRFQRMVERALNRPEAYRWRGRQRNLSEGED